MSSLAVILMAITVSAIAQKPAPKPQISLPVAAQQGGKIDFPITLVPRIPNTLPILKLTAQAPPTAFLTDTLGKIGIRKETILPLTRTPSLAARGVSPQLTGVVQEDKVLAYWHAQTGEAEIHPQLEQLRTERFVAGNNPHAATASSQARTVFARTDILPHDVTQYTLGAAIPLVGATIQKGSTAVQPEPALYLTYVAAHRTVQGYPVHGPGSQALLAVDNGGTIQAFSLHWKAASNSGQAKETRNSAQVYDALKAVVQPLATLGDVQVLSVGVIYYDDWEARIAPAYRLTVRVHDTHNSQADDGLVILYAQYGDAPLSPTLTQGGEQPEIAPANMRSSLAENTEISAGDPTIGVYVIQNAERGWLSDAQGFIAGLGASRGGNPFNLAQYYWAQTFMYSPNAASFVDNVQVAETEGHGNWWLFATSDHTDVVNFDTYPASGGYGTVNHGKLNYWILHGCEIVPSPQDAPCPKGAPGQDSRNWTDPWWRMFQGLHTVVGFRTPMWINDEVGGPFATSMRNGTPVISAWFHAVETAGAYQPPDSNQGNLNHCGLSLPMGRPAAVTVCGHSNDTIFDQASIPAASCLTIFWQPN
jgi:hypothetical protein